MNKSIFVSLLFVFFASSTITFPLHAEQVSCEQITDHFCEKLWLENKGDYKTPTSQFLLGEGPGGYSHRWMKDQLRYVSIVKPLARYMEQIGTEKSLIKDFKKAVKEYKEILLAEEDSAQYDEDVDNKSRQVKYLLNKISKQATLRRVPSLKTKSALDYDIYDKIEFSKEEQAIDNRVLELKYADDPQWKLVKKLFEQIQQDFILEIQTLRLSENEKQRWIQKISTVELSLPYTDPRVLGVDADCATKNNNAYYYSSHHKFTICMGMLNGMQSQAMLYYAISHELAHAIDPYRNAFDQYKNTKAYKTTLKLLQGHVFACEDWQNIQASQYGPLDLITKIPKETDALSMCLLPEKTSLVEFEDPAVRDTVHRISLRWLSDYSTDNWFTFMTSLTTYINHKKLVNPYRGNPQAFQIVSENGRKFITDPSLWGTTPVMEIFNQNLHCSVDPKNQIYIDFYAVTDSAENEQLRETLFENAIIKTQKTIQNILEQRVSFTNDESYLLVDDRLAKSSIENFADWFSFKLLKKRIEKIPEEQKRRDYIAESVSLFCTEPSVLIEEPQFTRIEKKFSYQEHADDRVRRLSIFTDDIRALLACKMKPQNLEKSSFGDCAL